MNDLNYDLCVVLITGLLAWLVMDDMGVSLENSLEVIKESKVKGEMRHSALYN